MTNTPEIQFKSDALYGFFYMWMASLIYAKSYPQDVDNALRAFNDEWIFNIKDVKPKNQDDLIKMFDTFRTWPLKDGATFSDMKPLLKPYISEKDLLSLSNAYNGYKTFFDAVDVTTRRLKNNVIMYQMQDKNLLAKLYKCFDVDTKEQPVCQLIPYPKTVIMDGWCTGDGCLMNYSLNPYTGTERDKKIKFVNNSDIQEMKSFTPIHEATHFIFAHSKLFHDLKKIQLTGRGANIGIQNVVAYLEAQGLKRYPNMSNPRSGAINSIHEAFASCAGTLCREITLGTPITKGFVFYEEPIANELARNMYPVFKEYIAKGQRFDDTFFERIYKNMNNEKAVSLTVQNAQQSSR